MSRVVPFAGAALRLVAGVPQELALLALGLIVFVHAAVGRVRRRYEVRLGELRALVAGVPVTRARPNRSAFHGPWWWARLAAITCWGVGVLSITASATFTTTATLNQGAISSGHMALTLPASGSTYRLQTGASNIAPADFIERPVDVQIDATTSPGIMSGIQLAVSSSTSGSGAPQLDDGTANGMRFWVQGCSQAWTQRTDYASAPGYNYTCGGSRSDVIGTYGGATALPTPGSTTCPPGGTSSLRTYESPSALGNVNTSASSHNYLVVFMCFPNDADNAYQDLTTTLTFAFTGVQRGGTAK